MTKKEIIDTVSEIYGKLEELESMLDDFRHELKSAKRLMEDLPGDEADFTEEEKKEDE